MKKILRRATAAAFVSLMSLAGVSCPSAFAVPADAAPVTSADPAWGINDPHCVATGAVKEPVVLLHGTWDNAGNWRDLVPVLKKEGMCVWALDYGAEDTSLPNAIPANKAIGDLDASAREIAGQIDYVRKVTGAAKVNLVGHSQGGMHTKTYEQMYGVPGTVARVVAIGGNYHGTTLNGMADGLRPLVQAAPGFAAFIVSTASVQQLVGSPFITHLNTLPDTSAGVQYTSIYSPADTTVTPNSSSQLAAVPGADVDNVNIGQVCGVSPRHDRLPHDRNAIALIRWGLTRGTGEQPTAAACASEAQAGSVAGS